MKEGCIPEDWKSNVILPIYKGKGDPMERGSYRGIKLFEHAMKVVERIFENRIRQQIEVDDMQFGFMKGKGTTDALLLSKFMTKIIASNSIPRIWRKTKVIAVPKPGKDQNLAASYRPISLLSVCLSLIHI